MGFGEDAQSPVKTVKILCINDSFLCKILSCFKMYPVKSGQPKICQLQPEKNSTSRISAEKMCQPEFGP